MKILVNNEIYFSQKDSPKPRLAIGSRFMELTSDLRYVKRRAKLFVIINNNKYYVRDLLFVDKGVVFSSSNNPEQSDAKRRCISSLEQRISSLLAIPFSFVNLDGSPHPHSDNFFESNWGTLVCRETGIKVKYLSGSTSSNSSRLEVNVWGLSPNPDGI